MGVLYKAHLPCRVCPSSDGMSIYRDNKTGQLYWKCFSANCGQHGILDNEDDMTPESVETRVDIVPTKDIGKVSSIPDRGITKESCEKYGVVTSAFAYRFPYTGGYKVRKMEEKEFWAEGKLSGLFGMDKFPSGGKFITITEGEMDALAAFQMLGSRYPVVSLRNGAGSAEKELMENFKWLDTFDKVVICFDNDEAGQAAAKRAARVFQHKALVVKLTKHKDASDYLRSNDAKEFVDAWWRAENIVPPGIVNGAELWDRINTPPKQADCLYPFEELNKLTYGIRKGELVMVTAGSGLGKSQFLREIVWQMFCKTEEKIGLMFLEEATEFTAQRIMSIHANKPFHIPTTKYTPDEYRDAYDQTLASRRFVFYDTKEQFGSNSIDNIVSNVRYLVKAQGCQFVLLDHISIIVSSQEYGDERKALDEIMTRLRTLVQELNIGLICVSHLKRPDGKGHEEGAATSLAQLRGSGSIAHLSDIVIGLERDGQAEDPVVRNTTKIRVLKNRFSGLTGPCGCAIYYPDTGRMLDCPVIDEAEAL